MGSPLAGALALLTTAAALPPLREDVHLRAALDEMRDHAATARGDGPRTGVAAAPPATWDGFDAFVKSVMDCPATRIPGLAVSVVHKGQVVYKKAYGLRDVERNLSATTSTLWGIGSTTKSFTAATLGVLAEQGRWDLAEFNAPVSDVLPDYKLRDEAASKATLRDLMTHRTGMPRHDHVWLCSGVFGSEDRHRMLQRWRHLPSNQPFRYVSQYNNWGWMTVGLWAAAKAGTTWEQAVRAAVLDPLGMNRTTTSVDEALRSGEYAVPYQPDPVTGENAPLPRDINKIIEVIGPAGSLISSADDMVEYLNLQLGHHGRLSQGTLAWLHRPLQSFPDDTASAIRPVVDGDLSLPDYAAGFWSGVYRGWGLLQHGGDVAGHHAIVWIMPGADIGVVVIINGASSLPLAKIAARATDVVLGLPPLINDTFACPGRARRRPTSTGPTPVGSTGPTSAGGTAAAPVPCAGGHSVFAGNYTHPGYGTVTVTACAGGELGMRWGVVTGRTNATAPLPPTTILGPDTFIFGVTGSPLLQGSLPVQFHRDVHGAVVAAGVTGLEPSVPAIVFTVAGYLPQLPGFPRWDPDAGTTQLLSA